MLNGRQLGRQYVSRGIGEAAQRMTQIHMYIAESRLGSRLGTEYLHSIAP
jgi:hypothetical protein